MGGHQIDHDRGRHSNSRGVVRLAESLGSDWNNYSGDNGWNNVRRARILVLCGGTTHNVPNSRVHVGRIANVLLLRLVLPNIDTSRLGGADRMVHAA